MVLVPSDTFCFSTWNLKVLIKIRISAALFTNTNHFVHSLPQDNLAQQEMVSQQGLLLQQQKQFTSQQLLSHLQYQPSLSAQPQPNLFTQQSTIQTPQPKRHVSYGRVPVIQWHYMEQMNFSRQIHQMEPGFHP